MRVALYARVSTDDKGQNPESQLMKLREVALRRGYQIAGEPYIDYRSGKDDNRPALQRMLLDAKARKFDLILCTKLDRMMRSTSNLFKILQDLDNWGIKFECSDQDIDTKSPTGHLLFIILSAVAEFERELISSRVRDGMARARAEGKPIGRPKGSKDKQQRKIRGPPQKKGAKHGPPFIQASREGGQS